jgi:Prolyl oligopeptidase family
MQTTVLALTVAVLSVPCSTVPAQATEPNQARLDRYFSPPSKYAGILGDFASPLKFYDGRPVRTAKDWPARRREILDRWHGIMGLWPPLLKKPRLATVKKERRENFTQRRVRVEVADGLLVPAILLVPDGKGPFPAVVVTYYDAETGAGLRTKLRDFGYQLTKRGFVTLSIGGFQPRRQRKEEARIQRLSFEAYGLANCHTALANLPIVDAKRIGVVGHSYGGKKAMFASCLYDRFACAVWSDGGIVFDEKRANVNYWEPWYLGYEPGKKQRREGIPSAKNPRTGAYKTLIEQGRELHELHALMAPRPFLVSGGAEDRPHRWIALNHANAVNKLLGYKNRVALTSRKGHSPTKESNDQVYAFFERFLKPAGKRSVGESRDSPGQKNGRHAPH